jgi:hypothetical protein
VILNILGLLLFATALINAWVTFRIMRDNLLTSSQRVAQTIFVWLLPALGAMFVLHMQRQDTEIASEKYRETPNPGDDFGMPVNSARHENEVTESDSQNFGGSETSD